MDVADEQVSGFNRFSELSGSSSQIRMTKSIMSVNSNQKNLVYSGSPREG